MSTIHYPPEIVLAKNKLKRFDMTDGYEKLEYVKEFSEGLMVINEYILSNPNSPFLEKLTNLKRAHAQRLLLFIKEINLNNINIDADNYCYLFGLIRFTLKEEAINIGENSDELSSVVQQFFQTNSYIAAQILPEIKRLMKTNR